jgi:F-type H+-transporting ATPase subunit delta
VLMPSRAARRYAKAVFGLALETGQLDAVKDDLSSLQTLALQSNELARFLGDYHLSRQIRETLLTRIFSDRLHPLSFQFLRFLESKRRLGLLSQICVSFVGLHDSMSGIVRGRLTSAFALDSIDVAAISDRAEAKGEGRLRLDVDVDADLLGGFRLRIGDVIRDLSMAGQLRRLRQRLVYG